MIVYLNDKSLINSSLTPFCLSASFYYNLNLSFPSYSFLIDMLSSLYFPCFNYLVSF